MSLTPQQTTFYENTLAVCKQTIEDTNLTIQEEQLKFKNRMLELDSIIQSQQQQYAIACEQLGIPNDLDEEEGAPKV
jgi:hypothetical protein